jgi:rubredoxin
MYVCVYIYIQNKPDELEGSGASRNVPALEQTLVCSCPNTKPSLTPNAEGAASGKHAFEVT